MKKLIKEMTLEEKIGQLFAVTSGQDTVNGDLITLIKHYHIGGVLLTLEQKVNSKRLTTMNRNLQYYASNQTPLLIASELQVDNFTEDTPEVAMPSEEFFHQLDNRLYTKQLSEVIGQGLRDAGINAVMYPNLHVENKGDLRNKVDAHAYHGEAAIHGLQQGNVVSVVTGCPSSGEFDSFIEPDRRKSNLYPFYEVIGKGVDVLTVNETSSSYIHEQIRGNLQYENIIAYRIVEDVGSATDTVAKQIIDVLNNGVNFVILPFTFDEQVAVLNKVMELAKLGEIDEVALEKSLAKLFTLKKKYMMNEIKPSGRLLTSHQINNVKRKIVRTIAQRVAVTK